MLSLQRSHICVSSHFGTPLLYSSSFYYLWRGFLFSYIFPWPHLFFFHAHNSKYHFITNLNGMLQRNKQFPGYHRIKNVNSRALISFSLGLNATFFNSRDTVESRCLEIRNPNHFFFVFLNENVILKDFQPVKCNRDFHAPYTKVLINNYTTCYIELQEKHGMNVISMQLHCLCALTFVRQKTGGRLFGMKTNSVITYKKKWA